MEATLIVTHIPKTAGTSLRIALMEQFPPDVCFTVGDDIPSFKAKLSAMEPEAKSKIRLVFGHICYGWHKLLPQPCKYTTILREPVSRVLSLYDYIVGSKTHYLYEAITRKHMTLKDFVTSGVTSTAENAMVRQLCGRDSFTHIPYQDMTIPFGRVTTDELSQAIYNLGQDFALVGTMDNFTGYMTRLGEILGVSLRTDVRANTRTHTYRPTEDDIQAVIRHTRLDAALYSYAEGLQ